MDASQAMEFLARIESGEIKSPGSLIINRSKAADRTFQVNGNVAEDSLPVGDLDGDEFSGLFAQDLKVGVGDLDPEVNRGAVGEEVSSGESAGFKGGDTLKLRIHKHPAEC